jgi:hypothetical protein
VIERIRASLATLAELPDVFPTPLPLKRERRALVAALWADRQAIQAAIDTIERIEKLTVMRRRDYVTAQAISDVRFGFRSYAHTLGDLVASEDSALRRDAVVPRLPSAEIAILGETMGILCASLGRVRMDAARILLLPEAARGSLQAQRWPDLRLTSDAVEVIDNVADHIGNRHGCESLSLAPLSDRGSLFEGLRGLVRFCRRALVYVRRRREAVTSAAIKRVHTNWRQESRELEEFLSRAASGFPRLYLARWARLESLTKQRDRAMLN